MFDHSNICFLSPSRVIHQEKRRRNHWNVWSNRFVVADGALGSRTLLQYKPPTSLICLMWIRRSRFMKIGHKRVSELPEWRSPAAVGGRIQRTETAAWERKPASFHWNNPPFQSGYSAAFLTVKMFTFMSDLHLLNPADPVQFYCTAQKESSHWTSNQLFYRIRKSVIKPKQTK